MPAIFLAKHVKQEVLHLFHSYPEYALVASLAINIVIALLGFVPSVFLTAANILFFGFWEGTFISFAGESIGAFIAFLLYRYGFKRSIGNKIAAYPQVNKLLNATGQEAFLAILSLRLIPFVPSGIITFAAAIGAVRPVTFLVASSVGKAPALLMEGYAAYQVTAFNLQGKLILAAVALYLLYYTLKKIRRGNHTNSNG